jgi:hypothetical protein
MKMSMRGWKASMHRLDETPLKKLELRQIDYLAILSRVLSEEGAFVNMRPK